MFDDCYLRLGRGPFASCTPLTVQLLAGLYALPARDEPDLRGALDNGGEGTPWSASLAVAPEQTLQAVSAMLRQVMLATVDLNPASIRAEALEGGCRARYHLEALLDLWAANEAILPADLARLKHFLASEARDAVQPLKLIWDSNRPDLTPLERAVLERLEAHHGAIEAGDADATRLIGKRQAPAAPEATLAGHVQRFMLDPQAPCRPADDSFAVLSVRDNLSEGEAAAAIIQNWLAQDPTLKPADIGVILPADGAYAASLADAFAVVGLAASTLPAAATRRNVGAEAVLHFVECRRRPAPAMALASLYSSPVLCWPPEVGAALAAAVMGGDYAPRLIEGLSDRAKSLFHLIRSPAPATTAQLKDQLRRFRHLLSEDEVLKDDVVEAKAQLARLAGALGGAADAAEPDFDKAIRFAAAYQPIAARRGAYLLGGVRVMLAHEAPDRSYRKLLVLGFNDGAYPCAPSGNPFFLDSEVALIREQTGLTLPSMASQLDRALALFIRQLRCASEQIVLLLSERDRSGGALAPSSSLPLMARLVERVAAPDDLVVPMVRGAGTIWDRLVAWRARPEFKAIEAPDLPPHLEFGIDLLGLRRKEDGSLRPQSPSRLETLLVSPLAWLLGELGARQVSWAPETLDVMLRGSLAHEVFEQLFPPGSDYPDHDAIAALVPDLLMERIRAIAPFLQSPAWLVERRTLESEIVKAARHWSQVLSALGAEIVGNEFWLSGEIFGHPVHGKADCLLRLADGQAVVIDYKKSSSGGRRKRLRAGWDLQVDLYRRMNVRLDEDSGEPVRRMAAALATNRLPGVAYHMLNDGGVLVNGLAEIESDHLEVIDGDIAEQAVAQIEARFAALRAGRLTINTTADADFFTKKASLGTYALQDSPLIAAFLREDDAPSVILAEEV